MDDLEIRVDNLSKSYGDKKVLNGVDLIVKGGTIHCILGLSGSGKTTLLSILAGLLPFDKGSIEFNDLSISDIPNDQIRVNYVGIIFQQFQMFEHMSVMENVMAAISTSNTLTEEYHKKALGLLEDMGMLDHINKLPDQLSGGQLQRVGIARALINNPDLVIADEPSGSLDKQNSDQILQLLKYITKQGKAVILSTHDIDIAKVADEVSILRQGHLFSVDKKELETPNSVKILYEVD